MISSRTIVRLTIPFTFADEGKYQVKIDETVANIEMEYIQNNDALDRIMEIESMGRIQLMPDDPEGMYNISKITLEFPFLYSFNDEHDQTKLVELCFSYLSVN